MTEATDTGGLVAPDILAAAAADAAQGTPAAQPGADPAAAPPVAPKDHKAEAADLLKFASGLLFPLYPSLAKVYTPEIIDRLSCAAGPLLEKYGVNLESMFGRWGPEIGFAIVAVPLIAPTVEAIRADRAALKAAAEPPKAEAADQVKPADPQPLAPQKPVKQPLDQKFPGLNADNPQPPTVRKGKK